MTGRSIEFAMEEAFTPLYGARKDEDAVQKILIVLTDGRLVDKCHPGIHGPPNDFIPYHFWSRVSLLIAIKNISELKMMLPHQLQWQKMMVF